MKDGAGRVDPQAIELLRDLPRGHRSFLLQKFGGAVKKSWNAQRKFEKIAQLIGPRDIARYKNLYLDGNGSSFVWFKFDHDNAGRNVNAIYNYITRTNPGVMSGLFPKLGEGKPPQLHRLLDYGDYIALEYASQDATRTFTRNWKPQHIHVDRVYRVVIRNNPFTIEVRAPGLQRQKTLLDIVAKAARIAIEDATRCDLTPKKKYDALDKKLTARFSDSHLRCSTDGLSGMRLSAALGQRMDQSKEWLHQLEQEGREETQRYYEFETVHLDGYREISVYSIDLDNGDLRLSARSSERAAEKLRQHVIELF